MSEDRDATKIVKRSKDDIDSESTSLSYVSIPDLIVVLRSFIVFNCPKISQLYRSLYSWNDLCVLY